MAKGTHARQLVAARTSIIRPDARRREFHEVVVGISKVKADATALPMHFRFDQDSMLAKPDAPVFKIIRRDCKSEVSGALGRVRRDQAAG